MFIKYMIFKQLLKTHEIIILYVETFQPIFANIQTKMDSTQADIFRDGNASGGICEILHMQ
jgi:hypothetical protein